jgi:hypothetical protein
MTSFKVALSSSESGRGKLREGLVMKWRLVPSLAA